MHKENEGSVINGHKPGQESKENRVKAQKMNTPEEFISGPWE